MDIEKLAVAHVQKMIARCPHLRGFIAANDKTPFTDGHIDIYHASKVSNGTWEDRINVQVKGRTVRRPQKPPITFAIDRTSLQAFERLGGVLYVLVNINEKSGKETPYCVALTPFKIKHLLAGSGQHERVTVTLRKFPALPESIERIVEVVRRGNNQRSASPLDAALYGRVRTLTIYSAEDLLVDAPVVLSPDVSNYALEMTTDDGVSFPVDGIIRLLPQDYVPRTVNIIVQAGSTAYKQASMRRVDENKIEAVLSPCLTLIEHLNRAPRQYSLRTSMTGDFSTRWKAVEFLLAVADNGFIEMNGQRGAVQLLSTTDQDELQRMREYAAFLREVGSLLQLLDVDGHHVILEELSDRQLENLRALYSALVLGEERSLEDATPSRSIVDLGSWQLMVLVMPGATPDKWRITDLFAPEQQRLMRWTGVTEGEKEVHITVYDVVDGSYLPQVLNLHLETVVDSYKALTDTKDATTYANRFVMALLVAADTSDRRRNEFLDAAQRLNDWITEIEGDLPRNLVNAWQIDARRAPLTDEQRTAVRDLKHRMARAKGPDNRAAELSCAFLLGDKDEAAYLSAQFTEQQLRKIQGWPIWALNPTRA